MRTRKERKRGWCVTVRTTPDSFEFNIDNNTVFLEIRTTIADVLNAPQYDSALRHQRQRVGQRRLCRSNVLRAYYLAKVGSISGGAKMRSAALHKQVNNATAKLWEKQRAQDEQDSMRQTLA